MSGINNKQDVEFALMKLARFNKYKLESSYQCFNETKGTINLLSNQEKYFGFFLAIIEYLACYLKLKLNFHDGRRPTSNSVKLIQHPYNLKIIKQGTQFPIEVDHQLTILTSLNMVKNSEYFQCLKLFDINIWLCILFFYLSYTIFFKIITKKKIDLPQCITIMMGPMTGNTQQISQFIIKSIRNPELFRARSPRKFLLRLLLSTWLLVSMFLTRSFTSLLLNSYFNIKSSLVVNSLEDIENNLDIMVVGRFAIEATSFHKEGLFENLRNRTFKDERRIKSMVNNFKWRHLAETDELVDAIHNGKLVALFNEHQAHKLKRFNPSKSIVVAPKVYYPTYSTIFISNKIIFKDKIIIKLFHLMESGIYNYMRKWQIFKEVLFGRLRERLSSEENNNIKQDHNDDDRNSKHKDIEISELTHSVILMWAIGIVLSIVCIVVEVAIVKPDKKLNKRKSFSKI